MPDAREMLGNHGRFEYEASMNRRFTRTLNALRSAVLVVAVVGTSCLCAPSSPPAERNVSRPPAKGILRELGEIGSVIGGLQPSQATVAAGNLRALGCSF